LSSLLQSGSQQDEEETEGREGVKTYILVVIVPFLGKRKEGGKEGEREREAYVDLYLCYTIVMKERKGESEKRETKTPQFRTYRQASR
jgi:hypothetical protein